MSTLKPPALAMAAHELEQSHSRFGMTVKPSRAGLKENRSFWSYPTLLAFSRSA